MWEKRLGLGLHQQQEVIQSFHNRGQYRLLPKYSHFTAPATTWEKMRPQQRCNIVEKFDKAALNSYKCSLSSTQTQAADQVQGTSHDDM